MPGRGAGLGDHRGLDHRRYPLQDAAAELYQLVAGDWDDQALATLANLGDAPAKLPSSRPPGC